jgi:hypothetical protein
MLSQNREFSSFSIKPHIGIICEEEEEEEEEREKRPSQRTEKQTKC